MVKKTKVTCSFIYLMLINQAGKILQKTKSMLEKVVKRDHLARTTTKKVIELMPKLKEGCISAPN